MSTVWLKNFLKQNYLFIALTILAFLFHFAFLTYPSQTVFDEVYFGKFSAAYFTREYYFDIHPPLGKLMIAGWAKLTGFVPVFEFSKIGESVSPQLLFTLRFLPAFFGALLVPLFSWFAYLSTRSKKTALAAGALILLDNAFLVQSKIIAIDIFLIFFEILTFCFFLLYQKQKSFSAKWFGFLILTGVSFGLAASTKWTGFATIAIIGVILVYKIFNEKLANWLNPENYPAPKTPIDISKNKITFGESRKTRVKEALLGMLTVSAVGFLVYAIPFYIHFNLLTKSGPGDAFMSREFQDELRLGKDNSPQPLSFWQKFNELNFTMLTANWGLTSDHPFGSRWYSWPFDKKPIYYWAYSPEDGSDRIGKIYFLGSPALWWLALGAIGFTLIRIASRKERQKITPFLYVLLLAYFANFLPFIGIKRVSFLYHYMLSAAFAILALSFYLEKAWQKDKAIFTALMIIIIVSFAILTPLSYGWLMTPAIDKFEMGIIDFLS